LKGGIIMGRTKKGNANAQRNNNAKQKNGSPQLNTFEAIETERRNQNNNEND
jgi:hypothetical protein